MADNYALHIDFFSAIATDPTYSGLKDKKFLLRNPQLFDRLFHYLTDNWDEPVIVLFSTSKYEICAHFGLTPEKKIYEVFDLIEAYKVNNKIFVWGKPYIKPFQSVGNLILTKSLNDVCHMIGVI